MVREQEQEQTQAPFQLVDALYFLPENSSYYEMYRFLAELGMVQFWGSTPEHVALESQIINRLLYLKGADKSLPVLLCGAASKHSPRALLKALGQCGARVEMFIFDPNREGMPDFIYG